MPPLRHMNRCAMSRRALLSAAIGLLVAGVTVERLPAAEQAARLIDSQAFDQITLNAANEGAVIDTLLLDLPNRRVPNPFPASGFLELRRVSEPSVAYKVPWTSIAKIELYEQMLLAEAVRLTNAKKFVEAYEHFAFLHKNYPHLPGLAVATNRYLQRDALAAYQAKRYDEALSILYTLHDRNAQYPGLSSAVGAVSDRLIRQHLAAKNYVAARHVLELLERAFSQLELRNVPIWRQRFQQAANRQIESARAALQQKRYAKVRTALRRATAILPSAPGARELFEQMSREHPEVVVGVARYAPARRASPLVDWASARVSRLVDPNFVELSLFGAEGGIYHCDWANLEIDDTGQELSVQLTPAALRQGISPGSIVLRLLSLADRESPDFQSDFAELLQQIAIDQGRNVRIRWRRAHVRPESLLRFTARSLPAVQATSPFYRPAGTENDGQKDTAIRFELTGPNAATRGGPRSIVERPFADDRLARHALVSGQVDLLDRIAPWQIEKLRSRENIVVGQYRLPTVHVLLLNFSNPLLGRREFRRALCYGIDRERLVRDILLAGQSLPGFRTLSGPLPAGTSRSDSVGYGYKHEQLPRPYEPRLAAVLATVARAAVEKQAAIAADARAENTRAGAGAETDQNNPSAETQSESESTDPAVGELVLMFPAEPVARTVCQSIKLQLDQIGIPIHLQEQPTGRQPNRAEYDLLYAELSLQEPVVDARRLLGPRGVAGRCSASMSLALDELDRAQNWKQVQAKLHRVHQTAFYDLPVIPLWQTYNYFAHRQSLRGFGTTPISCYQHVADWRRTLQEAGQ